MILRAFGAAECRSDHTHDDVGHLVFGCPGCVRRAEHARWEHAPLRRVHCQATVPKHVVMWGGKQIAWTYTVEVRVPDGADLIDITERGLIDDGAAMSAAMPDLDDHTAALSIECAEVEALRIENIDPEPQQQPHLFEADQ